MTSKLNDKPKWTQQVSWILSESHAYPLLFGIDIWTCLTLRKFSYTKFLVWFASLLRHCNAKAKNTIDQKYFRFKHWLASSRSLYTCIDFFSRFSDPCDHNVTCLSSIILDNNGIAILTFVGGSVPSGLDWVWFPVPGGCPVLCRAGDDHHAVGRRLRLHTGGLWSVSGFPSAVGKKTEILLIS